MPPSKVVRTTGAVRGRQLIIDIIDAGQGNAVLVSYPNGEFMLVDCGSTATSTRGWPFTHVRDYIHTVTQGQPIATVVLSHGEKDHTAFVPYITEAAHPTTVHFGGQIGDYRKDVQDWIHAQENQKNQRVFRYPDNYSNIQPDADFGTETYENEAWTSVLAANFGDSVNGRSIVLMLRWGSHAVVLPGDADTGTEAFIIAKVPKKILQECTLLMAGHHGANSSSGPPWLDILGPEIAAVSASGSNMSFAHPNCATLTRLERESIGEAEQHDVICSTNKGAPYTRHPTTDAVVVTATNGDVRFISNGDNWKLLASSFSAPVPFLERPNPALTGLVANGPWNRPPAVLAPQRREVRVATPSRRQPAIA